jgi:hypothetical protein
MVMALHILEAKKSTNATQFISMAQHMGLHAVVLGTDDIV